LALNRRRRADAQALKYGRGHPVRPESGRLVDRADGAVGLDPAVDQTVDHLVAGAGPEFGQRLG
jgi:hypothetical protein